MASLPPNDKIKNDKTQGPIGVVTLVHMAFKVLVTTSATSLA